ncbi:hypothetical protein FHR99_003196 [Litorivivens lipolytica]|uniref:Flagellar transcriptional activator FlhC n=1 Tax=Litorivivens lipolytica TaxID=1524264 RepID=A0A7W4W7L4_9GAMM|nr:FlhC family transcriptional regulator [Litorivivens lipolytica]MBB3048922.1 hypothetical protein [Litorivivens lipolytica]
MKPNKKDGAQLAREYATIDYLTSAGMHSVHIQDLTKVNSARLQSRRLQLNRQGLRKSSAGGGKTSARSTITNTLQVLEHTIVLKLYAAAAGCNSENKKDPSVFSPTPETVVRVYRQYLDFVSSVPAFYPLFSKYKRKLFNVDKVYMLIREYALAQSRMTTCGQCKSDYASHPDQSVSDMMCPFCKLENISFA